MCLALSGFWLWTVSRRMKRLVRWRLSPLHALVVNHVNDRRKPRIQAPMNTKSVSICIEVNHVRERMTIFHHVR
ncbi:hypothetical protein [Oceaniferula spumae]|uniref:hypothetical protein n=1 Tax=Oceaniferula spumae TaxID=2979115 RepID=UPI003F4EEE1C